MAYRILVIDDEEDILEFIKYNLQRDGYEVYTAQNGAIGLERALEVRPHLILLDMMMPVLDGVETCKAIRRSPKLRKVMVVFLSAVSDEEMQLQGYGAGADDYISKPVKMNILRSRVKAILNRISPVENDEKITIDHTNFLVNKGEDHQTILMIGSGNKHARSTSVLPRIDVVQQLLQSIYHRPMLEDLGLPHG